MKGPARSSRLALTSIIAVVAIVGGVLFAAVPSVATVADGDVVLGTGHPGNCTVGTDPNCSSGTTEITDSNTSGGDTFVANSAGQSNALGGFASGSGAAVDGLATSGPGVRGDSTSGIGVRGHSTSGTGVYGTSDGADGVVGELAANSTGTNGVTGAAHNGGNGVNAESNSAFRVGVQNHFNAGLFAQNTSTGTSLWARNLQDGGEAAYIEAYGTHSRALRVCGCNGADGIDVSTTGSGEALSATNDGTANTTTAEIQATGTNSGALFVHATNGAAALTVGGPSSFIGSTTFGGGASTFNNTSTFKGASTFTGSSTFGGASTYNGPATFNAASEFQGNSHFGGTATFGSFTTFNGNTRFNTLTNTFSRSGVVGIMFPGSSATVTGIQLTDRSMVLATIQNYVPGVFVVAAVPVLTGPGAFHSFTIHLNRAPGTMSAPKSVQVAWFVIEHP